MNLKQQSVRSAVTIAALALCASLAQAQPPNASQQQPAPVERQAPPDQMGPGGMRGPRGGPGFGGPGMGDGGGNFRGGRGGFRGRPEGRGMEGGLRMGPGGMWWKNPTIVQRLNLTADQTRRMDGIFEQSRLQLIDVKANLEKQEVMLEPLLGATTLDTAKATAQIDKVADARAELEKANAKMLLGLRGVLTPDQWSNLNVPGQRGRGRPAPAPPTAPRGTARGPRNGGPAAANARPSNQTPAQ